jgi:caa(3)-type oxidase subunit IV
MSDETTPAPEEKPEEKAAETPAETPAPAPAETPAPADAPIVDASDAAPAEGRAPDQPGDAVPTPAPAPVPASIAAAAADLPHDAGHGNGHGAADDGHDHAHGLPFNPWAIFFALLILTGLSWGADAFLGGNFSILTISVIVMAISTCKATLVIAFFMHYRYETKWKYVLTIPPMIVGVLIMLALIPDVGFRTSGSKRPSAATAPADGKRGPASDPVTGEKAAGNNSKAGEHGAKKGDH